MYFYLNFIAIKDNFSTINIIDYIIDIFFTVNTHQDDCELANIIKFYDISLNTDVEKKISKIFDQRKVIKNAATFYQLARNFHLLSSRKVLLSYIEFCFTMIVDTKSFTQLDFRSVSTLLASSNLRIDSELEVYNAAETWLNYNIVERGKFAKSLLRKVRLTLLSNQCLKNFLEDGSTFSVSDECAEIINKALENKVIQNSSKLLLTSRFCSQNKYSVFVCGGTDIRKEYTAVNQVLSIDACDLKKTCKLPPMLQPRYEPNAVCINGEVYVVGGFAAFDSTISRHNFLNLIEKYSPITNTWCKVTDMYDDRYLFCSCAFMDKIFFIGGSSRNSLQLNTKNLRWKEISATIRERRLASCVAYEENLVVACGDEGLSKSVESYDIASDIWTSMPSLVQYRARPGLVVAKRKLFVMGGAPMYNIWDTVNCEVFDNFCNKFVALKSAEYNEGIAVSTGNKIVLFSENRENYVLTYDVEKDEWSKELSESELNYYYGYARVNLPLY